VRRVGLLLPLAACAEAPDLVPSADLHGVAAILDEPGVLTCSSDDDVRSAHIDGNDTLRGLLADTTYSCQVAFDGGGLSKAVEWSTDPLPADLPLGSVVVPDPDAGAHLVNLTGSGDGYLVIVDAQGRPRWQYSGSTGVVGVDATLVGTHVTWCGDQTMEIDLDGRSLWLPPWSSVSPFETPQSWHHDAAMTEDGTALLTLTKEILRYDGKVPVDGFVVRQVPRTDAGTAWYWSVGVDGASEFPALQEDSFHANAISEVDGGYLLGLRNAELVVKLDAETRSVAWRLGDGGDFTLLEADGSVAETSRWFGPHHDAKLEDGYLSLFDNGHVGRGSRAMVLEVDEEAMTARIVYEWQRDEDFYAGYWGGVDRLPDGGVSVAFGQPETDGPPSALLHADADGQLAWELEFEPEVGLYRSQWLGDW
jgi:hypothetical protein